MALATDKTRGAGVRNMNLLYNNAGVVTAQNILFIRTVTPDPKLNTLTYEGDDNAEESDTVAGYGVSALLHKVDWAAISRIYNKHMVTGIGGETWRLYFGDDSEVSGGVGGLRYDVVMRDETTGASATFRYTFHKGFWRLFRPPQAEFGAIHGITLNFTSQKTTVDVANVALTGVPTDGTHYSVARLS